MTCGHDRWAGDEQIDGRDETTAPAGVRGEDMHSIAPTPMTNISIGGNE